MESIGYVLGIVCNFDIGRSNVKCDACHEYASSVLNYNAMRSFDNW